MKVVDLHSGIGGLSAGLEMAGFNVVGAVDNWEFAVDIYKKNFKHSVYRFDISEQLDKVLQLLHSLRPEVIVGGPPCQDFSHAGKRNENLGRGRETVVFADIVKLQKPQYFIMENVDRIVKSEKYKKIISSLKIAGYNLNEVILDASYCNVPQIRKRLFLFGQRGGVDVFLGERIQTSLAKTRMTLRDYFGDSLDTDHYYRHPRNYSRRAVFSVDEPSPTVRGVNRPIPDGYPGHHGDTERDLSKVRPLTTLERARIQTFPPSFKLTGSKTNLEQAIGNAVPVNLAAFVGKALMDHEQQRCCRSVSQQRP